jgi:hypothetical protein
MSLLGLVRHMAEVERGWFRRRFAGLEVPQLLRRGIAAAGSAGAGGVRAGTFTRRILGGCRIPP